MASEIQQALTSEARSRIHDYAHRVRDELKAGGLFSKVQADRTVFNGLGAVLAFYAELKSARACATYFESFRRDKKVA